MNKLNLGICQMEVVSNKEANLLKACQMIDAVTKDGAELVILPEMFNTPYDIKYFAEYAEEEKNSSTLNQMSKKAKEKGIYLVAGSIPEKLENLIYNTSFVFNPQGEIIARHRKVHLFDIEVKDKIRFKESEVLSPGDSSTIIDTAYGKIGIMICYDIRFPELARKMALEGAKVIIVPAAFNMVTGPAHWETLFRCRAIDNQIYMVGVSSARNLSFSYHAYGHSIVTNSWGETEFELNAQENASVVSIDLNKIDESRSSIPIYDHRRVELY